MSIKLTTQLSFPLQNLSAVTVIATPDNVNAQMVVNVFNVAFYGSLTLRRVVNSVEMDVRGATNIAVQGAATELVVDYECPLDTTVTYRAYLDTNQPIESSPVSIVTDGRTFWLKDVILGAFSTKVNIESMADVTRGANVLGSFHVINRANPVIITDVRQGRTGSMVLLTKTTADITAINNIMESGNTLLLQCPLSANFPDMYFQAGDITESWNGGQANNVVHSFTIPFTETDPPSQSALSLDFNSWLLVTQWDSWNNVLDDRATWKDVFTTPFNDGDNNTVHTTVSFPTPQLQIGAHVSTSATGGADFNAAYANWQTITGINLAVTRWYQAQGDFSIGTTLTQMLATGLKVCLTLRPNFNPVSSAHLASIDSMLATLKANGAVMDVTLWHEPYYGGLTAAQFVAMVKYYGPTVRKYFPLWVVFSGNDADVANGFYPGDDWCDGVAVDAYAGSSTTQITNAQSIADAGSKPFGFWEFNGAADLGSATAIFGNSQATVTTHYQYIQNLLVARVAAGKPNGAVLLFSAGNASSLFAGSPTQAGGFEGGIANWVQAGNCTIAQSGAQFKSGANSLAITCSSTSSALLSHTSIALGSLQANALPCVSGNTVAVSVWSKAATLTRTIQAAIYFYDSAGGQISSSFGGGATNSTSSFVRVDNNAVAPANTAFAVLRVQVVTPGGAGEIHYIDDPQLAVIPSTNDLSTAIQYPWDYRIGLFSTMKSTLGA